MTRLLFIVSGVLFLLVVGMFVLGISTTQAGWMFVSLTCGMYLFVAVLVAAVARFTMQYKIEPRGKSQTTHSTSSPIKRLQRSEPLG